MIILKDVDAAETERIHDGSFPFPDFSNPLYISKFSAVDNAKLIAVGVVRLTAEGILFTDRNVPLVTRAKASYNVMNSLREDLKVRGLDECHGTFWF
jgi:hypothetical protein